MNTANKLNQLKAQASSLSTACSDLDKRIAALTLSVDDVKKKLADSTAQLASVESERDANAAQVKSNADQIASLNDLLSSLEREEVSLPSEIVRAKGPRRGLLACEVSEEEQTVLLAVRVKPVIRPAKNYNMAYPDAQDAFPPIPQDETLPGIDAEPPVWAFADCRHGEAVIVDEAKLEGLGHPVFLVGDIHGDESSLRSILEKVFAVDPNSIVVFLGDLFDRGPKSMEAIRLFLWAAKTHPGQFLWLRGNHDEALVFEENTEKFVSGVSPHEFADWLCEHPECKDEGRAICTLVRTLPSVAVLGSVWASHGGVLHEDTCKDFHGFADLTPEMKIDFVWSRMKDTPSKMPNRSHKGAEVGYKQAVEFVQKLKEFEDVAIRHVVCAHQHEHKDGVGYLPFAKCFSKGALTCQCVCSFRDTEWDFWPVILQWRPDGAPRPIRFRGN